MHYDTQPEELTAEYDLVCPLCGLPEPACFCPVELLVLDTMPCPPPEDFEGF
jgi:hypothetical protein